MKEKKIYNARRINKMRFISGIVICSLVILLTTVVLVLNLIDYYNYETPESGINNLRMFTTISNIIAEVAAIMCLPFQIDGLRRDKYNLPSWIVILFYIGAVGVFLTFFIALTLISSFQGFTKTMFLKSNLFLHTINPLLITLVFTLVISDTHVKFRYSFISLIPTVAYMIIYFIMVFVTKSWRDHYYTDSFIRWPISLLLLLGLAFGISQLLRFLHNLTHKHVDEKIAEYYLKSPDYDFTDAKEAVKHLATIESKFYHQDDDVYIPDDVIRLLAKRYGCKKSEIHTLYDAYLAKYLVCVGKKVNQ